MGLWDSIKARLGLGDEDEYYDEYYGEDEEEPDGLEVAPVKSPYDVEARTGVRRVHREPDLARTRDAYAARTPSVEPLPTTSVRAVPQVKMQIVEPRSFAEAQSIADKFKNGMPVIMNLTMAEPELARRLIDFASGLTYGLNGGLQKVSEKVFMLTPANVDVNAAQRKELRERGLFDSGV
ncbi:MAG: cell division protein SepF [Coriobacteriia bacterium]|nr:cell division protein SepF [Coriobacteriia bacterium]